MIKLRRLLAFFFALFIAVEGYAQQTVKPQIVFNLEGKARKQIALPEAVLAVLKSDRIVDGCFKTKGANAKENDWFGASEIDLNDDGRADLIVKAKDSCLFGANQAPFWVFQNATDGYQKILSASGLQLTILNEKSNSFNRIKISRLVAMKYSSEIFSFRAGKYRAVKAK